jgi:hypothetical protein
VFSFLSNLSLISPTPNSILGYGKTQLDAVSVRATHPIPSACGLYYYEVKIINRGSDGYTFILKLFQLQAAKLALL